MIWEWHMVETVTSTYDYMWRHMREIDNMWKVLVARDDAWITWYSSLKLLESRKGICELEIDSSLSRLLDLEMRD